MLDASALDQFAAEPATPVAQLRVGKVTPKPALSLVKSDTPVLLDAVTRGLSDSTVPADKLRIVVDLYERNSVRDEEKAFTIAMGAAQEAMAPIRANALNDSFDSQYATYAALDAVMRPIYLAHGFVVSFTTKTSDLARHQRVVVIVKHRDGHKETAEADFPATGLDDAGEQVQSDVHAAASALTYGQRYMLAFAFNIAIAKDRDGNVVAPPSEAITGAQVAELAFLIDSTGGDEPGLLAVLGARDLAAIPSDKFDHAKWLVQNRKAA